MTHNPCKWCGGPIPSNAYPGTLYCRWDCKESQRRVTTKLSKRRRAEAKGIAKPERRPAEREPDRTPPPPDPVLPPQRPHARFYRAASLAMTPAIADAAATRGDMLTGSAAATCHESTRQVV